MNSSLHAVILSMSSEAYLLGALFVILVATPGWAIGTQLNSILRVQRNLGSRHQRFETYVFLEQVRRQMEVLTPIGGQLIVSRAVMSRDEARRIWNSTDNDGIDWESKVMLTNMLEAFDRLASGARMGILDMQVWQAISGPDLSTIYECLQAFIEVSQEHRPGRYVALGWVHDSFTQMARTQKLTDLADPADINSSSSL